MRSSESEALNLDGLGFCLIYPRTGSGAAPEEHDGDGNECNVGKTVMQTVAGPGTVAARSFDLLDSGASTDEDNQ